MPARQVDRRNFVVGAGLRLEALFCLAVDDATEEGAGAAKSSANAAVRDGPREDDGGAGAEIAELIKLRWIASRGWPRSSLQNSRISRARHSNAGIRAASSGVKIENSGTTPERSC